MNKRFNLEETLAQIKARAFIDGKDDVLAALIKELTEITLEAEPESHIAQELRNRKNGKSSKTMKSWKASLNWKFPETVENFYGIHFSKARPPHILYKPNSPLLRNKLCDN